jgi:uroporphyrinogen-III synthase
MIHRLDPPPGGAAGPLHGRGIVVTRPGFQAAAFAARIAVLGARPIVFPTIVILPPPDRRALDDALRRLEQFDFAVFVSANAVEYGVPADRPWPAAVRAIAPGPGTAAALHARGVGQVLVPAERFDSEGILALPELADVHGRRFLVLRGNGGRELLADALVRRGATVEQVACYVRAMPATGAEGLSEAWRAGAIDAFTVTSSEGLANLWEMLDDEGRRYLAATPVFAPHPRIAEAARRLGCREVHETAGSDAGLVAGLLAHFGAG